AAPEAQEVVNSTTTPPAAPTAEQVTQPAAQATNANANTAAPENPRSYTQALSNKVNNALSKGLFSGNQKTTINDPVTKATTVTTTDKSGKVIATKVTQADGT